ncbi:MAG: cation:dicarboxylase symporter family transporter, partial [Berryella intestinalis]|nr:cation:dicarboxylase symporter family transporter [Berryella intestinalis]
MKSLLQKWSGIDLIVRILIGLVIGALLGVFAPADLSIVTLLGSLFVNALKSVAPILVFFLVISALANAKGVGTMKTI